MVRGGRFFGEGVKEVLPFLFDVDGVDCRKVLPDSDYEVQVAESVGVAEHPPPP